MSVVFLQMASEACFVAVGDLVAGSCPRKELGVCTDQKAIPLCNMAVAKCISTRYEALLSPRSNARERPQPKEAQASVLQRALACQLHTAESSTLPNCGVRT